MRRKKCMVRKLAVACLCFSLAACGTNAGTTGDDVSKNTVTEDNNANSSNTNSENEDDATEAIHEINVASEEEIMKDAESIQLKGDGAQASISSGAKEEKGMLTITKPGSYILSGDYNGGVLIDVKKEEEVFLVLDNANIVNENGPAIYAKHGIITVTIKENTKNSVADGKNPSVPDGEENPISACIYSKDDLIITGEGELNIRSNYKDAIKTKDVLYIVAGTITIDSEDEGLVGKDAIHIQGGNITITAKGDGLQSDEIVKIDEGYVTVLKSEEAIEARIIELNGGTMCLTASDDGLNASVKSDTSTANTELTFDNSNMNFDFGKGGFQPGEDKPEFGEGDPAEDGNRPEYGKLPDGKERPDGEGRGNGVGGFSGMGGGFMNDMQDAEIRINGGFMYVSAAGDGIDSNGTIVMNGGTVLVDGPTNDGNAALDYGSGFTYNGGLLIAAGSSGMAEAPESSFLMMTFSKAMTSGTSFAVLDETGELVCGYTPSKKFSTVVICSDALVAGNKYRLSYGGELTGNSVNGMYLSDAAYTGGTTITEFTYQTEGMYFDENGQTTERAGSGGFGGGFKGRH